MGTFDGGYAPVLTNDFSRDLKFDNPLPQIDMIDAALKSFEELVKQLLDRFAKALGLGGLVDLNGWADAVKNAMKFVEGILSGLAIGSPAEFIQKILNIQQIAQDAANAVGSAIEQAVETAVKAVIDGMKGIGEVAAPITNALNSFIDLIFGSGTSSGSTPTVRWSQEVLLAAGPVIVGQNDLPLGFGSPFPAVITSIYMVTSEHLSTGSGSKVVVQTRRNGSVIHTANWNGGNSFYNSGALNIGGINTNDRITFNVSEASSQMANMSITIAGRYS